MWKCRFTVSCHCKQSGKQQHHIFYKSFIFKYNAFVIQNQTCFYLSFTSPWVQLLGSKSPAKRNTICRKLGGSLHSEQALSFWYLLPTSHDRSRMGGASGFFLSVNIYLNVMPLFCTVSLLGFFLVFFLVHMSIFKCTHSINHRIIEWLE